jgi:uncharacterized protein (DUF2235 family)
MKRIITCSDGTWNKPNIDEKTNVQKIFDYVEKRDPVNDITQVRYYDEGIGAQGSKLTRLFNGATGKGIDTNIKDIYKFICWNYEPGDEIYLFGFSRGAYTARSLAGLIRKCGIIRQNNLDLIGEAYKLYRNKHVLAKDEGAMAFRRDNSYEVASIKFIGVWDTVGSLGLPLNLLQWYNKKKYTFYDTKLSHIIEHAYHALAVDERRKTFVPTLWEKSDDVQLAAKQTLEQRWFPGVHSNIGGGYPDCGLSDIALKWLFKKAEDAGLYLDKRIDTIPERFDATLYNSTKGLFSLLPKTVRPIVVDNKESFIDESVYKRMEILGDKYRPKNVLEATILNKG